MKISQTIIYSSLAAFIVLFSFSFRIDHEDPGDNKPKNLKVLPKKTTDEEIQKIMKAYAKSLGVRCSYCHVMVEGSNPPKLDFASDAKPEKTTARTMMKMTAKINKKYIHKINGSFEEITCVTCHMGRTTPINSVDSLAVRK